VNHDPPGKGTSVVEIGKVWKVYTAAGDVMFRISPVTIYSLQPSPISTTMGTYLSRIMIHSLMMAF
jgi:hypothetical protein